MVDSDWPVSPGPSGVWPGPPEALIALCSTGGTTDAVRGGALRCTCTCTALRELATQGMYSTSPSTLQTRRGEQWSDSNDVSS